MGYWSKSEKKERGVRDICGNINARVFTTSTIALIPVKLPGQWTTTIFSIFWYPQAFSRQKLSIIEAKLWDSFPRIEISSDALVQDVSKRSIFPCSVTALIKIFILLRYLRIWKCFSQEWYSKFQNLTQTSSAYFKYTNTSRKANFL